MNIDETKEAIKVMQAFVDGKEVTNTENPHWNWAGNLESYEIKPEPYECWISINEDGTINHAMKGQPINSSYLHMRQVE